MSCAGRQRSWPPIATAANGSKSPDRKRGLGALSVKESAQLDQGRDRLTLGRCNRPQRILSSPVSRRPTHSQRHRSSPSARHLIVNSSREPRFRGQTGVSGRSGRCGFGSTMRSRSRCRSVSKTVGRGSKPCHPCPTDSLESGTVEPETARRRRPRPVHQSPCKSRSRTWGRAGRARYSTLHALQMPGTCQLSR
jgi:hypothetical protein